MTDMVREICAKISSDPGQLARFGQEVVGFLEEQAVPPRGAYVIQLVLEELVTNIIKYAYDDASTHEIGVRVALQAGHAVVQVEDDGRPFDPLSAPEVNVRDPLQDRLVGGLGLHLVRRMAEDMDYRRVGDKNRVEVRIALADG